MHFGEVYERADEVVTKVKTAGSGELVFHLSPGTSAMTAMWLVLATTKHEAELIASTKENGVYTPEFPFEISADYLPRQRRRFAEIVYRRRLRKELPQRLGTSFIGANR